MEHLATTMGALSKEEVGFILPHEHIFVDFRTPDHPDHGKADVADVVRLMAPEVEAVGRLGVTAMVDSTPLGVGRRPDAVKAISEATGVPIVLPTGIYREPWVPRWVHEAAEDDLAGWMVKELTVGIDSTGVRAGWIKLSAGDDGITDCETKILRAAARAASATGAVIGSHTMRGRVLLQQADVAEASGLALNRLIWIHTQMEPEFDLHLAAARRGVWVEYDGIGGDVSDEFFIDAIARLIDAGFEDQILLSQDRGWFDPALEGGGVPQPFTYLITNFLPKLEKSGLDPSTIRRLTHDNPFAAFANRVAEPTG